MFREVSSKKEIEEIRVNEKFAKEQKKDKEVIQFTAPEPNISLEKADEIFARLWASIE